LVSYVLQDESFRMNPALSGLLMYTVYQDFFFFAISNKLHKEFNNCNRGKRTRITCHLLTVKTPETTDVFISI